MKKGLTKVGKGCIVEAEKVNQRQREGKMADKKPKCFGKYEPYDDVIQARRGCSEECLVEEECRELWRQAEQARLDARTPEEKAFYAEASKKLKEML